MAISAIAGLVSAVSAAAAGLTVFSLAATTLGGFAAAFALGAGLSMVSRALAPKPNLGAQMRGITQTSREPAGSRKTVYGKMRVGGQVVFISNSGDDNKYLNMAIAFASHEIESYEEIWFNDKKVWTLSGGFQGDWGTYVTIDRKFGTDGQAASTNLVNSNVLWTTNHKLSGIAYIAFRLEWDTDKFPQGVPNITAVLKGKKVYDPRSSSTVWSQNPALCLRDYMLDDKYGLGEVSSNIDSTSLTAAANLCEEQITLDAGGTQDRYRCNGVIETGNQIRANIEQLLASMGGMLTYSGGKYFIDGAEYKAPALTFTEADVISDIQTQTKQSRRGVYNGVKGIFVSEEKNYKVLDYPAQISSTYATEDGDPIYLDMALPFVTNNTQAQRLAKIALLKSRQQVVINMTVNLKGLQVKIGDTINVTNDRLNYSSKVFQVIDYSMAIGDGNSLAVNLACIETASAIYDWSTSDEEDFLSGGELELYDGRTVANVTSLALTEVGFKGPDGNLISAVDLTWTGPTDAFVELYKVRYNKTGTTNYFYASSREPRVYISGLDITSNYDFRVQAENLIGVSSSGTTLSNQTLNGDTTAPSVPTSTSATGGIQTITAEWSNPSDIDFKHVEVFVSTSNSIPATPTAVIDGEEYIVTGLSGASTRYFWLKSVDFSGNKSSATASFSGASVVAASSDIGTGAIGSGQIDTGAVGTPEIDDNAVTIAKIADTLESTNYVQGSAGWKLTTDGTFEAGNGTFRGALTATSGSIATTVTIGGTALSTVASGAASGATALQNGDDITDGTVGGITITSNSLYQGTGTWANSNTGFYLDNTGKFSLKDKLFFNPSNTKLTVAGNIEADTITVNDSLVVLGPLEAKSLAPGSITREMFSQDALDEIFGSLATSVGGSNGDFKENAGNFTASGGTVTLGTASDKFDHGTSSVDVEFLIDHFFYVTTNYTTTQAQATLNFEVSANGTFTDLASATKTHTLQFNEYDLSSYYGYTYLVYYLTGDVTKTFTTSEIADNTDLQFRVRVTSVGTAFTGQTVPFTLEANEGVTGVVSTGGNADTLDNLDSTAFLRSNTNDTFDGDLTITGQLILNGSIDQYNVTDLDVSDKTITVNSGNTQSLSDGAGLIVDRGAAADASILWDETDDQFDFSHPITWTGGGSANANTAYGWGDHSTEGYLTSILSPVSGDWWNGGFTAVGGDGVMEVGKYIDFHATDTGTSDYDVRITASSGSIAVSGTVTWTGGGSANANTAYTYSQVGHLPLAGGTLTGALGIVATNSFEIDISGSAAGNIRANSDLYLLSQTGSLYLGTNGVNSRLSIDTSGNTTITGKVKASNGSATKASYGFASSSTTGLSYASTNNRVNFLSNGVVKAYIQTGSSSPLVETMDVDGFITWDGGSSRNANTAYGWGNHASAGYLTAEADTLATVTARGNSTTQSIVTSNHTIENSSNPVLIINDTGGTGNAQSGWISFQDSNDSEKAWVGFGSNSDTIFTIRNTLNYVSISGSYLKATGYVKTPYYLAESSGSSSAPAYSFDHDSNTGMYRYAANSLMFSTGGANVLQIGEGFIQQHQRTFTHPASATGWYKIAKIDSRGGGRIIISYTGGSYTPNTYVIDYHKDWGNNGSLKLSQFGASAFITNVRLRYDNSDTKSYLEVYLSYSSVAQTTYIYDQRLMGYNATTTLYTGTLSAGSTNGSTFAEETFTQNGITTSRMTVSDNLGVGTPSNTGYALYVAGDIAQASGSLTAFGNITAGNGYVKASASSGGGFWVGSTQVIDHNASLTLNNINMNIGTAVNGIQVKGSSSTATDVRIANSGTGDAILWLDASNGDFVGSDYASIKQENGLDLVLGTQPLGGDIRFTPANATVLTLGTDKTATFEKNIVVKTPSGYGTDGGRLIHSYYSGDDVLAVISQDRSSGSLTFGYGAESSTTAAQQFVSTFDNFSGNRSAMQLRNNRLELWGTNGGVQTAVGSQLTTMTNRITLNTDTGNIVTTGAVSVGNNISFSGISQNAYIGIIPESDQNLMLGTGSGSEPRIYLKGQGNGQSDAGDVFIGAGSSGVIQLSGGTDITSGDLDVGGTETISSTRRFYASNGTSVKAAYSFSGETNTGWYKPAAGEITFIGEGVERFSISSTSEVQVPDGKVRITNDATSFDALIMGSGTQSLYTNVIWVSNGGQAQIWKAGSVYTTWGGASSMNIYNSNGDISLHPSGTANVLVATSTSVHTSQSLGVNTSSFDTTNLSLDVVGNASIRRGHVLYFGINTASVNSWQTRISNSGSTAIVSSQSLVHNNVGYGTSTFFTSNATGLNIGTGGLLINGTDAINSSREAHVTGLRIKDDYCEKVFSTPYFTHNTSNLAVDLTLGNAAVNTIIEVEVTGGYSYQNTTGLIRRRWYFGANPNNSVWQPAVVIDETMEGPIVSQLYISDPFWDSSASTYKIRIYKKNNTGNGFRVLIRNLSNDTSDELLSNMSMGSLLTGTSTSSSHSSGSHFKSGVRVDDTTVIDSSRNLTNLGTIASGVITAEGSSGGENLGYASNFAASGAGIQITLERKSNAAGWGGIGADNTYCFAAWGGSGGVTRRFGIGQSGNANLLYGGYQIAGTTVIDSNSNLTNIGTISSGAITSTGTLNLAGGAYEGSLVFGTNNDWHSGIRQHDDGHAEMRMWHKNVNGRIYIATGYDGEPSSISKPTDGLLIRGNKLGIGNFASVLPDRKLHVKTTDDVQILVDGDTTTWAGIQWKDTNGSAYQWFHGNTETWSLGGNGSSSNSEKRLHVHGGTSIGASLANTTVPTNGLAVEGDVNIDTGALKVGGTSIIGSNKRLEAADGTTSKAAYGFQSSSSTGLSYTSGNRLNFLSNGVVKAYIQPGSSNPISPVLNVDGRTEINGVVTWTGGSSTNANTAYGWGNHATQGYLTSIPYPVSGDWWNGGHPVVGGDGVMEVGKYIDFHTTDTGTSDYDVRLTASSGLINIAGNITATAGTPVIASISTTNNTNASVRATHSSIGGTGMYMDYRPSSAVGFLDNTYPRTGGQVYGNIEIRQDDGGMVTRAKFDNDARKLFIYQDVHIGDSDSTTRQLTLQATNTAGAPARTATILMKGYEGRAIGTVFEDVSYSGQEWFSGLTYSSQFGVYQIGFDNSGNQSEYAANRIAGFGSDGTWYHKGNVLVDLSRNIKPASVDNGNGTSVKPSYSFDSDSDTGFYRSASNEMTFLNGGSSSLILKGDRSVETSSYFRAEKSVSVDNRSVLHAAHYANAGNGTGAILIQLPGNRNANYSMAVFRITTYEYSSDAHNVYYVSGHDWTSGWYNVGVTHTGLNPETVKLVNNSSTNKQAILIGTTTTSRSYLHVSVDIIAAPSFYSNSMDFQGSWSIILSQNLSGWDHANQSNLTRTSLTSTAGTKTFDVEASGSIFFGGNSYLKAGGPSEIRFENGFGYIEMGPKNGTGAHIYTDLARFYFNKRLSLIDNTLVSYNGDLQLKRADSDTYKITVTTSGLVSTQNVTAYSDERLKKDIKPINGALETVKKLQGVTYTRRDSGNKDIGFIAQSIERDCPEIADRIVNTSDDEMGTKHLNYQNMVALLTEAIKDQQQQIDQLKDTIKEMTHGNHKNDNT